MDAHTSQCRGHREEMEKPLTSLASISRYAESSSQTSSARRYVELDRTAAKKRIITIIVALQVQIPRIVIVLLVVFIDQTLFQRLAFYHTRQHHRNGVQRETHSLSLAEAT